MNNGSLYLHTFIVESGKSLNPDDENYAGSVAIISKTKRTFALNYLRSKNIFYTNLLK